MENASKALIIAGTVLISVMIISLGVYLFKTFSNFGTGIASEFQQKRLSQFNAQFYKYEDKVVNAHDVVSIANLAKENNIYYQVETEAGSSANSTYIEVSLPDTPHFERLSEEEYMDFIKENSYRVINGNLTQIETLYKCVQIKTNNYGKVNYLRFVKN